MSITGFAPAAIPGWKHSPEASVVFSPSFVIFIGPPWPPVISSTYSVVKITRPFSSLILVMILSFMPLGLLAIAIAPFWCSCTF